MPWLRGGYVADAVGLLAASGVSAARRVLPASEPVLNQQFQMDATICRGDMQKANLAGVTFSGGGPKADIERLTVRDLSFRHLGLTHAFIHALAPGEIGRIVGR